MEKKRVVVFLDVDGVLNSVHSKEDIENDKVAILKKICKLGDSRIILSSTWKVLYQNEELSPEEEKMRKMLENALEKQGLRSSGFTPDKGKLGRPTECRRWLEMHPGAFDAVLILDDEFSQEDYDKVGLGSYLIQTKFFVVSPEEGGLQKKHIKIAEKILEKGYMEEK